MGGLNLYFTEDFDPAKDTAKLNMVLQDIYRQLRKLGVTPEDPGKVSARAWRSSANAATAPFEVPVAQTTPLAVAFDQAETTREGMFSVATPTYITVPEDGLYLVEASVYWWSNENPPGAKVASLYADSTHLTSAFHRTASDHMTNLHATRVLTEGTKVYLKVQNHSTTDKAWLTAWDNVTPSLTLTKVD